jgi:hypothetical protein
MRAADTSPSTSLTKPAPPRSGALSPVQAFLLLLGALLVIFAIFMLTKPERPQPSPGAGPRSDPPATSKSLPDDQAISVFKELHGLLVRAYRERDKSLIPRYVVAGSPMRAAGAREIDQLLEDKVTVNPRFQTRSLQIVSNDSEQIIVRQLVLQDPLFNKESGQRLKTKEAPKFLTVNWTLVKPRDQWKFRESTVVKASKSQDSVN